MQHPEFCLVHSSGPGYHSEAYWLSSRDYWKHLSKALDTSICLKCVLLEALVHTQKACEHGEVCANRRVSLLQALSGPAIKMDDPLVGLLFSLVAASAHIIVPAAVFNLKVYNLLYIIYIYNRTCDVLM